MSITNEQWLYACEQLLHEYKTNTHILSVKHCTLCEQTKQAAYEEGRRDGCAACLWKKYVGRTCGGHATCVVPRCVYAGSYINAMATGYWQRYRILHLEGWIWRLKREIENGTN